MNIKLLKIIFITAIFASIYIGCGSGGGGNSHNGNDNINESKISPTPTADESQDDDTLDTYESTSLISDYMAIRYNQNITAFEVDQKAIINYNGALGRAGSKSEAKDVIESAENHVKDYLDDSIQYISLVSLTKILDKIAIKEIINEYRSDHIYYMETFFNGYLRSGFLPLIDPMIQEINNTYDITVLLIDAI